MSIPSPCVSDCGIDKSTGFCKGCFRTLEEIKEWKDMKNDDKKLVVELLHIRKSDISGVILERNSRRG